MAKPTNKFDLIIASNLQFSKMFDLVNSLTNEEQNGSFDLDGKEAHWKRDKNIRYILIHIYEWHVLLLNWVNSNKQNIEKQFLPEQYNWRTYGEMNVLFWKKHQNTSYSDSIKLLKSTHESVMNLIENFTDEELFSKGYFPWTGGSTLMQYCLSTTSSHYIWAITKIKKYKNSISI